MSNIQLPASLASAKMDTYTRPDGVETVHVQAVVPANPWPVVTGTINANGQTVVLSGMTDADGVLVTTAGTFSGTIVFEASPNGTDWYAITMTRASGPTAEASRVLSGTTLEGWRANIAGWSSFRVRCSAYTSGTATIRLLPTAAPFEPVVAAAQTGTWTVQPGNTANTTPWLVTNRGNVFYNESTTNLGASATFTGSSRDVGIAAGSVQPYSAFNATVFADQAGTLRLEMSNDNTTWRRCTADTAVAANAPVTLSVPVVTRYHRAVYVNGASAQGAFMLNTGYTCA
jgi:hypothetical protein